MPNKEIEHITTLLGNYLNDIKLKGKFNWLSDHVHAEYFFKRLLNLLYDWKLTHTEELFGHNTPDIDLVSEHTGVVVQVTANSQPKTKIKDTVKGYKTNWHSKYPKLKILFIQTDLDYEKHKGDEYELITYRKIIQRIQNLNSLNQRIILEFLRQELSDFYDSSPYSLSVIQKFRDAFISNNVGTGLINNYYSDKDLIHFSEQDRKRIQNFENALKIDKTKLALSGPPCTGKTTLLFEFSRIVEESLFKVFYINLEIHGNQEDIILTELKKIACQDAILIIDNAHDHASISRKIFNVTIDLDIRTLFVYRRTSNDNLTDRLKESDFDWVETTDEELDNSNIERKFIGIINKRTHYLKNVQKNNKWIVGDIPAIIKNNESNFLKLSIALHYWENDPRFWSYRLDQIKADDVYKSFYNEHFKHSDSDSLINDLYLYGFLYQYGIPFYLKSEHDAEIATKGFIVKVPLAETFIFPHTEYAKLLKQSIQYWKCYDEKNIGTSIQGYIANQNPINLPLLLRELTSNEPNITSTIFREQESRQSIITHYSKTVDYQSILILINALNRFKNELESKYVEKLLHNTFSALSRIRTYEKLGEQLCKDLKTCLEDYSITNKELLEQVVQPKWSQKNRKSFFDIATDIRKKNRNENFVYKELHNRSFSTWLNLMNNEYKYGKVAEGITCLYKTISSRQLSIDLYQEVNLQEAYNNLKNQTIDISGKALSDMSELYGFDNKRKANQLLSLLLPHLQNQDFKSIGLLKYSIGISHIGKVNPSKVDSLFPKESVLQEMFEDVNANELSQRIIEIKNIFPTKEKPLLEILKSVISKPDFISKNSKEPRGLIKLVKQLKNLGFKISNSKYKEISDAILANKVSDTLLLAEIGVLLSSLNPDINISKYFNPKKIEFSLAHHRISLNHLEQILLTNAKKISPSFAEKTLKAIPVKAINISATESTISFSQMSSVYYRLYGLESVKNNADHMHNALEDYSNYRYENFVNKAKKANSWHLIEGISKLYEINKKVTTEALIPILEERIRNNNFRGVTLTNVIQPLKRLNNLNSTDLNDLTKSIIKRFESELIRNSKLLDIGKISTGLRELSSFDEKASKRIFVNMIHTISEKIKLEINRKDLANRIIPELEIASGYDIERIAELKKIARIE
jgi:hypothetical protein